MHSLLIIRNGKLIAEDYFYEFDVNKPHDLRSANKTITSILMGIAIDHGFIKNVDVKVYDLFPEYQNIINWGENKHILTIKHLLTMNTGLDCNDWDPKSVGNEESLDNKEDWIKSFLQLPFKEKSGSQFSYCTFGEIMARTIIVKATGMSLQDFAKEYLFDPLGIENYEWTMTIPNREDIGVRVSLTPRDFAKLGQLYLNDGLWNGAQIVSMDWVKSSVTSHTITTEKRLGYPEYGFLWWKNSFDVKGRHIEGYQAQGNGGQMVFVFPDFNMIVVFTAGNYSNPRMINAFKILEDDILPSLF
jgi:CubicO group peptidase (beta-lactamase class C family)